MSSKQDFFLFSNMMQHDEVALHDCHFTVDSHCSTVDVFVLSPLLMRYTEQRMAL